MKKVCLVLLFVLCLSFVGCSATTVEELLIAPQMSETQRDVVLALNAYVGEKVKLKYPRQGDNLSPFSFYDINGDGKEEAVVTYADETHVPYAQVAILSQQATGEWVVTHHLEGLDTDIDKIEFSKIIEGETTQIIIGYVGRNISEKNVVMYSYKDEQIVSLYQQVYFEFEIEDLTGEGLEDIILISAPTVQDGLQLYFLTSQDGKLKPPQITYLDPNFSEILQFYIGKDGKENVVVIDGYISSNEIATQVMSYIEDGFVTSYSDGDKSIPEVTKRDNLNLISRDIDLDGRIEVPVVDKKMPQGLDRFKWVTWYEYDQYEQLENVFGLLDEEEGYFVRLPMFWKDEINMARSTKENQWVIKNKRTSDVLLELLIKEKDEQLKTYEKAVFSLAYSTDEFDLYIKLVDSFSKAYSKTILNGVTKVQ